MTDQCLCMFIIILFIIINCKWKDNTKRLTDPTRRRSMLV